MVKEVDADGSGTVDFSEFLALMSKSVTPFFFTLAKEQALFSFFFFSPSFSLFLSPPPKNPYSTTTKKTPNR